MGLKAKIALVEERAEALYRRLKKCDLCPRNCQKNRLKGELGFCEAGIKMAVYTAFLHQGEEPAIAGRKGSGAIFFSQCNLRCLYCQNYKFSHLGRGKTLGEGELAKIMLKLQKKGAANINLVTPTHFLPQILRSTATALKHGLKLPLVYNSSGYEKEGIIDALEGIVGVYIIDMRYISSVLSKRYSNAPGYPRYNQKAILRVYRRLTPSWEGKVLTKGLIIRHLCLPGHTQETFQALSWIKKHTPQALVSVMSQYYPYFKANKFPSLNRRLNKREYDRIKGLVEELSLNGWIQSFNPSRSLAGVNFSPDFDL